MLPFKYKNVEEICKKLNDAEGTDKTFSLDKVRQIFADNEAYKDLKDD